MKSLDEEYDVYCGRGKTHVHSKKFIEENRSVKEINCPYYDPYYNNFLSRLLKLKSSCRAGFLGYLRLRSCVEEKRGFRRVRGLEDKTKSS